MSKKTRKNPPKPPSATRSSPRSGAARKTAAGTTRRTAVKKPAKKSIRKAAKASHAAPSKPLRSKAAAAPPRSATAPTGKSRGPSLVEGAKEGAKEGTKAPAFRLPRDGGGSVSLSDYAGRKLVLFFYPRADTPGCTREAIDFTRLASAFAESGTAVLGISADSPKAQQAFRDKHKLAVPLGSDEQHEMLEAYGAWGEKSMYGRTFLGIIRTTVLIGADGRIARIWRHVKVDGHADEVLAAARAA